MFYVLDLTVTGETVEGTLAAGYGTDMRTSRQRAMDALGLPGNEGPKAPGPRPVAGVVDGKTLALETTTPVGPPLAVTAEVGADRMRAEVRTGQEQRMVLFRRCRPARSSAGDDCSLDALWEQYLRRNVRRPGAPTPAEIRSANIPPTTSPE